MKIVAVVPIKLNNERAVNKNTRKVFGVPLVTSVLAKLLATPVIDEVYCYCSSSDILQYIPNGALWYQRPKEYDNLKITAEIFFRGMGQDIEGDIHVLCNATAPFLKQSSIQACIDMRLSDSNPYDSACTALPQNGRMWQNQRPVLTHDGWTCPRSQDVDPVFVESEGCWVVDSPVLAASGRRIGFNPGFVPVSTIEAIDLNTEEDWKTIQVVERGMRK